METNQNQAGTKINQGVQMFNTVQTRLERLNHKDILDLILADVKRHSVNNTENEHTLTEDQVEVLGGISYLVGLDFHSMNVWNSQTMNNVILRLLINKVNAETFSTYINVLRNLSSIGVITGCRTILMDKIKSNIDLSENDNKTLLDAMKSIIHSAIVPIEMVVDLDSKFYQKPQLSYHDLIVFNSFAYQESIFGGKSAQQFVDLSNEPNYVKTLDLASSYFELQKFGLFYEESILNFYSKNILEENELFSLNFFKHFLTEENIELSKNQENYAGLQAKIEEYFVSNIQPSLTEEKSLDIKPVTTVEEPKQAPLSQGVEHMNEALENPLENPTKVINHILVDFNQIQQANGLPTFAFKESPEDLIKSLTALLEVEDLIGSFYMFLSKYNEFKRTPEVKVNEINVSELFNYSKEKLEETFALHIADLQKNYTEIIEKYVKEIPSDKLGDIVSKLNSVITKLYIGNVDDKGLIFSQLNENTIFTYKHLHQMLEVVEAQYIKGEYMFNYINFKDFMSSENKEIIDLFEESQKLENYELQIKLLHTFISAFN